MFSLAVVDGADPAQVTPMLAALRDQALANLARPTATERRAFATAGRDAQSAKARVLRIVGRRADGRRVVAAGGVLR